MLKELRDEKFHAERRKAIGGSDVPSLLDLAPYGCGRRLWYDKKGIKPDFAPVQNAHMKRGLNLEDVAIEFFYETTARSVARVPWKQSAAEPWMACHADGLIENAGGYRDTLLEVKIPQARVYYQVRSKIEPPMEASLQAQWGMHVWDVKQGVVQLFSPDAWNHATWDVVADAQVMEDMIKLGRRFWEGLKKADSPHSRLAPTDRRCQECPWRKTCQGLPQRGEKNAWGDFDPDCEALKVGPLRPSASKKDMEEAAGDLLASQKALKSAKAANALAKARIEGMLVEPGYVDLDVGRVSLKVIRRKAYTATVEETTYSQVSVKPKVEEMDDADE